MLANREGEHANLEGEKDEIHYWKKWSNSSDNIKTAPKTKVPKEPRAELASLLLDNNNCQVTQLPPSQHCSDRVVKLQIIPIWQQPSRGSWMVNRYQNEYWWCWEGWVGGLGGLKIRQDWNKKTQTQDLLAVIFEALMIKWLISQQVRAVNTRS